MQQVHYVTNLPFGFLAHGLEGRKESYFIMKHLITAAIILASLAGPLTSSVFAQEREWVLDAADEDAFLVFGVAQTDDVGMSFWCKIGSGKINLLAPEYNAGVNPSLTETLALTVAGKTFNVMGRRSFGAEPGSGSVEAELALNDPLFDAVKSADRFSLTASGHKSVYPTVGADFDGLLKLCQKA